MAWLPRPLYCSSAACLCLPNLALYSGPLAVFYAAPGSNAGSNSSLTATTATATTGPARARDLREASSCKETFKRNFKTGKWTVKCTWTLVYTSTEVDKTKSSAKCSTTSSKALKPKGACQNCYSVGAIIMSYVKLGA